jgi:hypothetical protein
LLTTEHLPTRALHLQRRCRDGRNIPSPPAPALAALLLLVGRSSGERAAGTDAGNRHAYATDHASPVNDVEKAPSEGIEVSVVHLGLLCVPGPGDGEGRYPPWS